MQDRSRHWVPFLIAISSSHLQDSCGGGAVDLQKFNADLISPNYYYYLLKGSHSLDSCPLLEEV
jgi:hypothetical protein